MLGIGVDWVALSFVQQPADIVEIHALIDKHLPVDAFRPAVLAKIEKPSCFDGTNLEDIVDLCNGISKFHCTSHFQYLSLYPFSQPI